MATMGREVEGRRARVKWSQRNPNRADLPEHGKPHITTSGMID